MDGTRVGPLSYDVVPPDGEASPERAIIASGLAIVATSVVGMVGGWFVLGQIADARIVAYGVPLVILAVALGLAAALSRRNLRRARRIALGVVLALAMLASFLTYQALSHVEPALPQVRHTLDTLDLPDGFSVVQETTSGDRFCRNGCPTLERRYAVPTTDPDPVRTMVLAMFEQGWERTSTVEPELATTAHRDGVTVHLQDRGNGIVDVLALRDS